MCHIVKNNILHTKKHFFAKITIKSFLFWLSACVNLTSCVWAKHCFPVNVWQRPTATLFLQYKWIISKSEKIKEKNNQFVTWDQGHITPPFSELLLKDIYGKQLQRKRFSWNDICVIFPKTGRPNTPSHKTRINWDLMGHFAYLQTYLLTFPNTINIFKQLFCNWIPDILF